MAALASTSIAGHYSICVEIFNLFCNALQHAQPRFSEQIPLLEVQTEFGRLRVWAGNLGAHRTGRSSLDHRLREAGHMRQTTISLLDDLRDNLRDGLAILNHERLPYDEQLSDSDSSDSSSEISDLGSPRELEAILADIRQIISCLYQLAIALRNPAPVDRFRKADDIDTSHFEDWDVKHVREKFPLLATNNSFLIERLGKANSRRRQVFKYNKLHNRKLKHGIDTFAQRAQPVAVFARQDSESQQEIIRPFDVQTQDEGIRVAPSTRPSTNTMDTHTTIATFIERETYDIEVDHDDGLSETSSAASEQPIDEGALRVPEPPLGALDGEYFECPYCYEISRTPNIIRWRKHLFEDLQPYVCTFENCLHPNKTYGSRHEWFDHEAHAHRNQWTCRQCKQDFGSKRSFVDHMQRHHSNSFTDQQLPALLDMCSRPADDKIAGKCSFCDKENQPLRRHLAHHMMSISLFALPRRDDGDEFENGDSNKGQAGASGGSSSLEEGREALSDSDIMSEISEEAKKEVIDVDKDIEEGDPSLNIAVDSALDDDSPLNKTTQPQSNDFWDRAYQISSQKDQWEDYENFLSISLEGASTVEFAAMGTPQKEEMVTALVLKKAEIMEDPTWDYRMKSPECRRIAKAVLYVRDVLSPEANRTPHSALPWAGVLVLLPSILDGLVDSAGNESLFDTAGVTDAVDYISILINRLTMIQHSYIEEYAGPALFKDSFENTMTKLCAQILNCQAQAVSQLLVARIPADDSPLPELLDDLKSADAASRNTFGIVRSDRVNAALRQQGHRMDELFLLQKMKWQKQLKIVWDGRQRKTQSMGREAQLSLDACLNALRTSNYESSKNQVPDRAPGTCQWLLNHSIYQDWVETRSSNILWISAVPGYGKSVLAKSLIDNELQSTASVTTCYFFFRYDSPDMKNATSALSALLHQLCSRNRALLVKANEEFRSNFANVVQTFPWLWKLFISLANHPEAGKVICILDALDECEDLGKQDFIAYLNRFHNDLRPDSQVKILVTSRRNLEIEEQLDSRILRLSVNNECEAMTKELGFVIRSRVSQVTAEKAIEHRFRTALESRLLRTQAPTYLWLYLTLAAVEEGSGSSNPKAMANFIEDFPNDVEEAYEALLKKLSPQRERVTKLLHVVVAATRPLSLREMNMAMNIQEGHKSREEVRLQPEDEFGKYIVDLCKPFVNVYNAKVYLVHQTAKTWWATRTDIIQAQGRLGISSERVNSPKIEKPDYVLAKICLMYLSFDVFEHNPPPNDQIEEGLLPYNYKTLHKARQRQIAEYAQNHDFLTYAAIHWTTHYNSAGSNDLQGWWFEVCRPQSRRLYTWFRVFWYGHGIRNDLELQVCKIPRLSLIALSCFLGMVPMVKSLVRQGEDLEDGGGGWPPLVICINRRDTAMANFLIDSGASITSETMEDWTPVILAAARGLRDLTQRLIENGVNVEQKTYLRGYNALGKASEAGQVAVVETLLRHGAEINTSYNDGRTAIMEAAKNGHQQVVEMLIRAGADVGACDHDGRTALRNATANRHEHLAQLLLEHGAEADTKDENGRTPLSLAAQRGLLHVTRSLIARGASLDSEDDDGLTPLLHAIQSEHDDVVQELLSAGTNTNAFNKQGQTALLYALRSRTHKVTQILLEAGADPNITDENGQTLLMLALPFLRELGPADKFQCWREAGADFDIVDKNGRTALSYAAEESHLSVIQALLDVEASPNIADNEGRTPLHYAAAAGFSHIVELFIMANADVNVRDRQGKTPIDIAKDKDSAVLMREVVSAEKSRLVHLDMT